MKNIFLLVRIPQWSKAVFVFVGVLYAHAGETDWLRAVYAALAFCFIASAVYIYNDLHDLEEDKLHPKKSRRPLASSTISIILAKKILGLLVLSGFCIAFMLSYSLMFILSGYIFINIAYNYGLRQVPISDVLCVASGFMLRIFAGTLGIGLPITWWLTLTATILSLFIALCKRRLEMQLNHYFSGRSVLKKYDLQQLDGLIMGTGIWALLFYIFYTVYARDDTGCFLLTIPFAMLGLWRFTQLTTNTNARPIKFNVAVKKVSLSTPHQKHVDALLPMHASMDAVVAESVFVTDDPVLLFLSDALSCLNLVVFFVLTLNALWQ